MKLLVYLLLISITMSCSAVGTNGKPGENGKPGKGGTKGDDGKAGENGQSKIIGIKL